MTKVQLVFNFGDDIVGVIEDTSEDQEFQTEFYTAYPDFSLSRPVEIEKPKDFLNGLLAEEGR